MSEQNPISILKSETVTAWQGFELIRDRVRLPSGLEMEKYSVNHPGAVLILPIHADGSVLLTRQYRHSIRRYILEFPAGTLEPGEEPLACAQREVEEEVGHSARRWTDLGILHPAPGFCDEVQYCFVAELLTETDLNPDEDEIIEVRRFTVQELDDAVASFEIVDGKSLALFARARARGFV